MLFWPREPPCDEDALRRRGGTHGSIENTAQNSRAREKSTTCKHSFLVSAVCILPNRHSTQSTVGTTVIIRRGCEAVSGTTDRESYTYHHCIYDFEGVFILTASLLNLLLVSYYIYFDR